MRRVSLILIAINLVLALVQSRLLYSNQELSARLIQARASLQCGTLPKMKPVPNGMLLCPGAGVITRLPDEAPKQEM